MATSLIDNFQRAIRYLRISVTDQCDLRCFYCIPKGFKGFQEPNHWLTFNELEKLVHIFAHKGVKHIRVTGGEPLLRKNLPDLIQRINATPGIEDISLSTNALALKRYAHTLQQAGLKRVNISLDSLQAERYQIITQGRLHKALTGIQAAQDAGIERIKINMVVMRGINDDEVENMLEFCLQRQLTLRFIETMPMGDTGRLASKHYLSLQAVKQQLAKRYELIPELPTGKQWTAGPARYMRIANSDARIGFITPISDHFCELCNRVRLSVDGTLYPCLGQNSARSLRELLRSDQSEDQIAAAIDSAIAGKPQKHEFKEQPAKVLRFMSFTGG